MRTASIFMKMNDDEGVTFSNKKPIIFLVDVIGSSGPMNDETKPEHIHV